MQCPRDIYPPEVLSELLGSKKLPVMEKARATAKARRYTVQTLSSGCRLYVMAKASPTVSDEREGTWGRE
jgi:hypothetical protein